MLIINLLVLCVILFIGYFFQKNEEQRKLEDSVTTFGSYVGRQGGYGGTGCYVIINPAGKKEIKGWIRNCRYCNALPGDSVLVKYAKEDPTVLDFVRDDKGRLILKRKGG